MVSFHLLMTRVRQKFLYAKTDEDILSNNEYKMSGNKISVKTLDLTGNFDSIKQQLNKIVNNYFGDVGDINN